MKAFIITLILLVLQNVAKADDSASQIAAALESSSVETQLEYTKCVETESHERNCVNDILGDIWE